MEITTHDPEIVEVRRTVIELILSKHPNDCLTCAPQPELRTADACAPTSASVRSPRPHRPRPAAGSTPRAPSSSTRASASSAAAASRSASRCRTSGRWSFLERGIEHPHRARPATSPWPSRPASSAASARAHCPIGAIDEYDETHGSLGSAARPANCIAWCRSPRPCASPSARPSASRPGTYLTGKIYAALRRLGFKAVFDTNFGADLTIMEEATRVRRALRPRQGRAAAHHQLLPVVGGLHGEVPRTT